MLALRCAVRVARGAAPSTPATSSWPASRARCTSNVNGARAHRARRQRARAARHVAHRPRRRDGASAGRDHAECRPGNAAGIPCAREARCVPSIASCSRAATSSTTSASAKAASCASKLRYLVGVVKGTQFNVAAQDEATTISLFEGLLEVRAADESGVVDLKAGEIASRQRDDQGDQRAQDGCRQGARGHASPAGGQRLQQRAPSPSPRATPAITIVIDTGRS